MCFFAVLSRRKKTCQESSLGLQTLLGQLSRSEWDVFKPQLDSHSRKLEFPSSLYQFDQLINCPTRVTETSATAIDLFLTNRAENILKVGTFDLGISDHSLILPLGKIVFINLKNFKDTSGIIFQSWKLITNLLGKNRKSNIISQS